MGAELVFWDKPKKALPPRATPGGDLTPPHSWGRMKGISRRDAISGIAATSAGLALTFSRNALSAPSNEGAKGEVSTARAFRGQHQLKPLGFDPAKLKGLSEKLIRSHWENNYGGAV